MLVEDFVFIDSSHFLTSKWNYNPNSYQHVNSTIDLSNFTGVYNLNVRMFLRGKKETLPGISKENSSVGQM